jgi:hypothetical protein
MAVQVLVAEVKAGVIVLEGFVTLPDGLKVTVVADVTKQGFPAEAPREGGLSEVPEKGLVAVDPEDAELIRVLHEADRLENFVLPQPRRQRVRAEPVLEAGVRRRHEQPGLAQGSRLRG